MSQKVLFYDQQNLTNSCNKMFGFFSLQKLIAVEIPFLVTLESSDLNDEKEKSGPGVKVVRNVMSDFVGLEESDKATRDAVIKFSFFLSIGNNGVFSIHSKLKV